MFKDIHTLGLFKAKETFKAGFQSATLKLRCD